MVGNSSRKVWQSTFITSLFCIIGVIFSHNAFALSKVTASVDKNPAFINESILLTVTADDDINRSALDTNVLQTDFIVGQTSVSSQTSIVNFNATKLTTWKIVLVPRRVGQFTIPELSINNTKSTPIKVSIIAQSAASKSKPVDIFVTSKLSSDTVYVQQLLTLTLTLHFSVDLKSGSMTEPSLTGANVEKIGKDTQSDRIINGKRYRIIEQSYAITPEQSGEFIIEAPVFSGEVLQEPRHRSSFRSFAQSKPVSVLGKALNLSVRPIPENYPDNEQWLPTDILTLHQELQPESNNFTVGEPITRTVTLTAAGLTESQLPKLHMQNSRYLKVYPDQAELHSSVNKGRLVSQKVQNFALVPSVAGDFTIPEMKVAWFNTVTNKVQYATLPAKKIIVKAAENGYNDSVQSPQDKVNNQVPIQPVVASKVSDGNNNTTVMVVNFWQWVFLSLWLVTILLWILHVIYLKRNGLTISSNSTPKLPSHQTGNNYIALLAACKKNESSQAINLLLPWFKDVASQSNGEINDISQGLSLIGDTSLASAINNLQEHLYGKTSTDVNSWQGTELLKAIQAVHKQAINTNLSSTLSLNP